MKKYPLFNTRYDLSNSGLPRFIKHIVLNRFMMIGNIFGNPGIRNLIILTLLHYLGRPIYWLKSRWGRYFGYMAKLLRKLN